MDSNYTYRKATFILSSLILLVFLVLTGCASSGKTKITSALNTGFSKYRVIAVEVTSKDEDANDVISPLKSTIIRKIFEKKLVDNVTDITSLQTSEPYIKISVAIIRIRKVSQFARVMVGAFAGQGNLVTQVDFIDGNSGAELSSATIEGTTSGGSAAAGTTYQTYERVAEQIADIIEKNM